jgi:hypothetical protein
VTEDAARHAAAVALWPLACDYCWPRTDELTDEQREQWDRVTATLLAVHADGRDKMRHEVLRDTRQMLADLRTAVDVLEKL